MIEYITGTNGAGKTKTLVSSAINTEIKGLWSCLVLFLKKQLIIFTFPFMIHSKGYHF